MSSAPGTALARGDGPGGMPVLELEQVSKVYPGQPPVRALDQASLAVAAGDLAAVVGPSGSGKSTLLNLMGTLDKPTAGTVRITHDHAVAARTRRRIEMLDGHIIADTSPAPGHTPAPGPRRKDCHDHHLRAAGRPGPDPATPL